MVNRELKSKEKKWIADYVKKCNLDMVNQRTNIVIPNDGFYTRYGKRILDIVLSLFACILTLPVNLVLAACTYLDVGKPIFFLQNRPGKDGKEFTIVKFRNMRNAFDNEGNPLPISQRVTKFGSFVRKTSLDELLNFYSILKGDMSFVGPRPLATIYVERYSKRHMCRHAVRPGLECPNVKNRGYSNGWHERLENDVWYVEHVSFKTDCLMVLLLIKMVFDHRIRSNHADIGVGDFLGYDETGHAFGAWDVPTKYIDLLKEEINKGAI